jgi:hypothetical protein
MARAERCNRSWLRLLSAAALLAISAPAAAQQDLGHKVLGSIGLEAGAQPGPGFYLSDRLAYYRANELFDRNGQEIPLGLDLDALANAFGARLTFPVPPLAASANLSLGLPLAWVSGSTERPEASLDRYGLGDLYVQPLSLGWRMPRADLVTGYGFYAPTGRFEPGGAGGVGRGHWTHQFSLGGTGWFDARRGWRACVLGSYDWNLKKRGIDITRGDTAQLQGGVGGPVFRGVTVGLAGYALWQVTDDSGSDLPPVLRGARDRAWGLGPEASVILPPLRSKLTLRYTHDVAVRSRPLGGLLSLEFTFVAWMPGKQ